MPLRRTKRSDGQLRPRWKDGSHAKVENTDAEQSRCDGLVFEPNTLSESLVRVQSLLELNDELKVSTRDRPARTGADARIEGSAANGGVRLATRPYGRKNKQPFSPPPISTFLTTSVPLRRKRPLLGSPSPAAAAALARRQKRERLVTFARGRNRSWCRRGWRRSARRR